MLFIYFTGYVEMEEFELLCWNKSVSLNVIDCFSFLNANISTDKNKGLGITPWTKILSAGNFGRLHWPQWNSFRFRETLRGPCLGPSLCLLPTFCS